QGGMPLFYVLSQTQPLSNPLLQVSSKVFAPKLSAGQRLAFKLRANPTICVTENGKQKRHDVLMHTKRQYKGERFAPKELEFLTFEAAQQRSEEHTSELQSRFDLVCRLLLEKKKKNKIK